MESRTIPRICATCGAGFLAKKSVVQRGDARYCSRSCLGKRIRRTTEAYFWAHVEKSDECWLWTGGFQSQGYGWFWADGRMQLAHRVSYALHYGAPLPDHVHCRHSCDTPKCVRPDHLESGSHADNMHDMAVRDRVRHGERHAFAKITAKDVVAIRARYAAGGATHRSLGEEYGLNQSSIALIIKRKNWARVP